MTMTIDIQNFTKDCADKGTAMAIIENKGTAKKSVTFCAVGRDIFKGASPSGELKALNAFADAFRARYIATSKQALSEYLQYIVKGYNAEAVNDVTPAKRKLVHCYSTKPNTPAVFTFEAKPAKQPKVKTASGKSGAPTGSSVPDSSNSTPEKGAAIIEAGLPLTVNDIARAYHAGQVTLLELSQLVDLLTAEALAKQVNKSKKADKKAA